MQQGRVHYLLGDFPAARAAIEEAQATALTGADRAAALAQLVNLLNDLGDYAAAQAVLAEALPLARLSGDPQALAQALFASGLVSFRLGKLEQARAAANESLALARLQGEDAGELAALNLLGTVAGNLGDLAEKERIISEVYRRATAAGNRERAVTALNNLGVTALVRQDFRLARDYFKQALAIARELGAQYDIALFLLNSSYMELLLGQPDAGKAGLYEAAALADRLGVPRLMAGAVGVWATLSLVEGQLDRCLALLGLARRQPAWSSDIEQSMQIALAPWALEPAVVEAGLAQGAALDWEATVQELLREAQRA